MDHGSVRNLEQIQESDGHARTPFGVTVLLVALGGACIAFTTLALSGRHSDAAVQKADPLGELVSAHAKGAASSALSGLKPTDLSAHDVTFPGILSDDGTPTTALAAVRSVRARTPEEAAAGSALAGSANAAGGNVVAAPAVAPPPSDRLPVVPLPAQNVLEPSPVVTRPRDSLTRAATDAAQRASASQPAAPAGREGGYQLQVSSFRSKSEAEAFANELRARSHKAYVLEARVAGRGTWYRVRIGPFASQQAAASYRSGFEGREHVVPFIVPPPSKTK